MGAVTPSSLPNVLYILALDPSRKFGSIEEQVLVLARRFKERGKAFVPVYCHDGEPSEEIEHQRAGLPCEFLDLRRFDLRTFRSLLRLVEAYDVDVVHWNFYHAVRNGYVWGLSLLRPGLIHFLTDHISRPPGYQPGGNPLVTLIKRPLLKRYARVLCISDYVLECLRETGAWSNLDRCTYFVNTDRFAPDPALRGRVREEMGVQNHFVVLLVAHLIVEKGVDVAVRALEKLPDEVVLWVVGDGVAADQLRKLADASGLDSRVRFFGNQSHVEPFMQAADCLACPSLWGEAVGLVNLEGLATGLPVVASAVGGIPEFIDDGSNGYLFPTGDSDAMAERIGRLMEDVEARRAMGMRARKAAVERFSIEARIGDYLDTYESALRAQGE